MRRGFSIVEVLLASSILALLATAFVGAYLYGEEATALAGNQARATFLAEEGLEAVRNIRDAGFANLVDGTYGLATTSNQWTFTGSSDVTGAFSRTITISTIDANRKGATSTVTWTQNAQRTGTVTLSSRLTYWQKIVQSWVNPNSLEGSLDLAGTEDGIKIQVSGNYAYVIRNGGSPNFVVIDISTPTAPVLAASLTLSGTPQNIAMNGNYAYVVSNGNANELQIIDCTNPTSPSLSAAVNMPGNGDALGVFVLGTTAFVSRANGSGDTFVAIDVTTPSAPVVAGSLNSNQNEYEIAAAGGYVYVATGSNAQELRVLDASNPLAPVVAGSLNLPGNTDAITIALSGSVVYVGQGSTLYAISIANPLTPTSLGSYAAGGTINDISIGADGYIFLATANAASELQVVNASNPIAMSLVGVYNAPAAANGVAYGTPADRAYLVGPTNTSEFYVIAP